MSNENKLTAKSLFNQDDVKNKFTELLGRRSAPFITSVLQVVASNELLKNAEATSIYQCAAVAATLDLPINNALGFAYIVPYNNSYKALEEYEEKGEKKTREVWKKKVVAQFQIGYKGYKQLALRSGQFKGINSTDVREGEIKSRDRLTGLMEFEWILDEDERAKKPIIGYVNHFVLLNGFSQTFYMSKKQVYEHAKRYSQTFKSNIGRWVDDFESMALKTVTKMNLSKNAPLSIEMRNAIVVDQAVIKNADTLEVDYVDNEEAELPAKTTVTLEELKDLFFTVDHLTPEQSKRIKEIIDNNEVESFEKAYTILRDVK